MAKPPPPDDLLDWFVEGHAALVAALRAAPADLDCWSFLPAPSPLAFWARRQAHETAIHRADADSARGVIPSYDPHFAADGIGELLGGFYARHVAINPDGRQISTDADLPADCTVSGAASDLYHLLWNRQPAQPPRISGDQAVMELWRERAQVKWR
jgi:uncharacterized protein (TIGR03083 family)